VATAISANPASHAELRRHEQRKLLEAYLRTVPTEDAGTIGTVSPSFEARGGPRPQPWAHFEPHVDGTLSIFPAHVLRYTLRVLQQLPWAQQQVLYLTCVLDQAQVDVAVLFRRSPRWVRLTKAQALTTLAEALWDDRGHPRVPAGLRRAVRDRRH